MQVWVRKGNMTGDVKVSLLFIIPHGLLMLQWLWVNWSTYRYLCEALKLAVKKNFSELWSSLCSFREDGCKSGFFPFPPTLSVPQTPVCLTPQRVCLGWPRDSGPSCGTLSLDHLPLPQNLLCCWSAGEYFTLVLFVKCSMPWAAI